MEQSCGLLIKQINDALGKRANNALRSLDLTMVQLTVLLHLSELPEKQTSLKELERYLRVAQSTTAGIITRLEQKGLLVGFGDASDKRIKMVRITEQGEACCAGARESMDGTEKLLLSSLSEEEQQTFRMLLLKISNRVK